jgi:hypothetical protein
MDCLNTHCQETTNPTRTIVPFATRETNTATASHNRNARENGWVSL